MNKEKLRQTAALADSKTDELLYWLAAQPAPLTFLAVAGALVAAFVLGVVVG